MLQVWPVQYNTEPSLLKRDARKRRQDSNRSWMSVCAVGIRSKWPARVQWAWTAYGLPLLTLLCAINRNWPMIWLTKFCYLASKVDFQFSWHHLVQKKVNMCRISFQIWGNWSCSAKKMENSVKHWGVKMQLWGHGKSCSFTTGGVRLIEFFSHFGTNGMLWGFTFK